MPDTHTVPPRLVTNDGAVYVLQFAPDDQVQLNVAVPCRTREHIRAAAAARGTDMQTLAGDILADWLAGDPLTP